MNIIIIENSIVQTRPPPLPPKATGERGGMGGRDTCLLHACDMDAMHVTCQRMVWLWCTHVH